ncbi:Uu.00g123050.m01.CDS01 [Anthostomella pinea]|uniref:Uu.00g123050.m01.CDS01 n=1 Tax=Anthostomella pinea TaxID=933095 RepID=A0AAI8VHV1_9PEZI|nr:Uu.00g123050.m01.CDS01 [Anthostomella pinea]
MTEARTLLRAHRVEHRIKHPHAAYSDAGKLLCKLCHEPVKTESLWEGHLRSPNHRQKLQALQSSTTNTGAAATPPAADGKRKHDDVDESISEADEDFEEAIRKKRSRLDNTNVDAPPSNGHGHSSGGAFSDKERTQTPPVLSRRTSGTPVQGVEIAIPSRPATPLAGSNSANSVPKIAPVGRSLLIGSAPDAAASSTGPGQGQGVGLAISTESLVVPVQQHPNTTSNSTAPTSAPPTTTTTVDEAEWAAFEAEMEAAATPLQSNPNTYAVDAYTISAPALTAAEVAAKSHEEENERRKHSLDAQMADEREDATRQLEAEFEEMEELEGRVRRLKERREELRKGSVMNLKAAAAASADGSIHSKAGQGKENLANRDGEDDGEEDEDDDEDEDQDEWDGFRFKA